MNVRFFKSQSSFCEWLEKNCDKAAELWLGFHKKSSGKTSITYPEALDEALCVGWIDGVRKCIDEIRYTIRFTPRKAKSIWSLVNIRRAEELKKLGRMKSAGLKAFALREARRSGVYSFENAAVKLEGVYDQRFRANKKAWKHFDAQPPGYKKTAIFWVMSAKKDETRLRRLGQLIDSSESGERLGVVSGTAKQPARSKE